MTRYKLPELKSHDHIMAELLTRNQNGHKQAMWQLTPVEKKSIMNAYVDLCQFS